MSWIKVEELKLNWFEKLAVNVIKQGKVPQHVRPVKSHMSDMSLNYFLVLGGNYHGW